MRAILRLSVLLLFACVPVMGRADPLVTVTLSGRIDPTLANFPISFEFSFDPAAYTTSTVPGFETDFLYPITPFDVPGNNTLDSADFSEGGEYLFLYVASQFNAFTNQLTFTFAPGSCQNLPADPSSGSAPNFVTKSCDAFSFMETEVSTPSEVIEIDTVDFVMQPSAVTPEPSTVLLVLTGGFGFAALARERLRQT